MSAFKTMPLKMNWFLDNIDQYLERTEFIEFQNIVGFEYRKLKEDSNHDLIAQKIKDKSSIFYEIGRNKGGAFFPEKVYREEVNFFNAAPNQIPEADELILARPMCYSLKFRFQTLNRIIIPYIIDYYLKEKDQIVVGNLGSGLGKDLEYASLNYDGKIKKIINIDIDPDAVRIGKETVPEKIKNKVMFYTKASEFGWIEG